MLPASLEDRGVDDKELLPNYPYRDDSQLYWQAIERWVSQYVSKYYATDADVVADYELQNWYAELVAQDGGRVIGLGKGGGITSATYLAEVVTLIVFTASVQHAAVNFPQVDLLTYVPNMPLAGYAPRPTTTTGATERDYVDMLPPRDQAIAQMTTGQMLGKVHYNHLGKYPVNHFKDERVVGPLRQFRREIVEIGETIEQRNRARHPYMYLTPSGVPQSINI
jgi:arachidonate 15-lipoxygenase